MAKELFHDIISRTSEKDKKLLIDFLSNLNSVLKTGRVASKEEVTKLKALKDTTESLREAKETPEIDKLYSSMFSSYLESVMKDFEKYQAKLSLSTSRADTISTTLASTLPPIKPRGEDPSSGTVPKQPRRRRALSDSILGSGPAGETPKIDPTLLAIRDPERTPEIKSGVPNEGRLPPLYSRHRRSPPRDDSDIEARLDSLLKLTDRRLMELLEVRRPDAEETEPNPVEQQRRRPRQVRSIDEDVPTPPSSKTGAGQRLSEALAFSAQSETASAPGTPPPSTPPDTPPSTPSRRSPR